jgi:Bacterial regulatory proteins, gntR family
MPDVRSQVPSDRRGFALEDRVGELGRGAQLPTELELRGASGVSLVTVRDAIKLLITRGLPRNQTLAGQDVDGAPYGYRPQTDAVMVPRRSGHDLQVCASIKADSARPVTPVRDVVHPENRGLPIWPGDVIISLRTAGRDHAWIAVRRHRVRDQS